MYGWKENLDIVFLQNDCLMEYMRLKKISPTEASERFSKHNIFKYISECFDYLHLSGTEYIVKDIDSKIKRGEKFDSGY